MLTYTPDYMRNVLPNVVIAVIGLQQTVQALLDRHRISRCSATRRQINRGRHHRGSAGGQSRRRYYERRRRRSAAAGPASQRNNDLPSPTPPGATLVVAGPSTPLFTPPDSTHAAPGPLAPPGPPHDSMNTAAGPSTPLGLPLDSTRTAYGPPTFARPSLDPTRVDAGPLRPIEAVHSYRPAPFPQPEKQRCLQEVPREPEERPTACSGSACNQRFQSAPKLYVLNPTSLAKPHALQHLHADLLSYNSEVAIISETWFKKHHADQTVALPGYSLHRHDRTKLRGGGVAI